MNKKLVGAFFVALFGFSTLVMAGHHDGKGSDKNKYKKMCMMDMNKGGMMANTQMVASNDGGVIVLCCNRIYKYDSNLNLVKETSIKMEGMGEKMCPMMGKMEHNEENTKK